MKTLLKLTEAADYLGIEPQALRRLANKGLLNPIILPHSKHRLFPLNDLQSFGKITPDMHQEQLDQLAKKESNKKKYIYTWKYVIGDIINNVEIISEPYKHADRRKYTWCIKCRCCKCDYEFERTTRYIQNMLCRKCCKNRLVNKPEILVGEQHGSLTVNGEVFKKNSQSLKNWFVPVRCTCGSKTDVAYDNWDNTFCCIKCVQGNDSYLSQKHIHAKALAYKTTDDTIYNLLKKQKNSCAICGVSFSEQQKMQIDHCHHSGKIRGLLCVQCNTAIGLFFENEKIIKKAIKYLKTHN